MDPEVRRRLLQTRLREHRQRQGLTQQDVARTLSWSPAKVNRIENGAVWVTPKDARALAEEYRVDRADADELVQWAMDARRGFYGRNTLPLSKDFRLFLGLEEIAAQMRYWQPFVVPGLLQTEDYARAVLAAAYPADTDDIDARIEHRFDRQRNLAESTPLLHAVLDEAVIRRPAGSRSLMKRQLLQLLALQELPHVTIQVLPFEAGLHGGTDGSFVLLSFTDQPDALYRERSSGSSIERDDLQIVRHRRTFDRLESLAAPPGRSNDLIAEVAESM